MTLQEIDDQIKHLLLEVYESLTKNVVENKLELEIIKRLLDNHDWEQATIHIGSQIDNWESFEKISSVRKLLYQHDIIGNQLVNERLSEIDFQIIGESLKATVYGPFFPDWVFHTLFGVERHEVKEILDTWPKADPYNPNLSIAINNACNNLLGYPHGEWESWNKYLSFPPQKVEEAFNNWRKIKGWSSSDSENDNAYYFDNLR